MIKLDDFPVFVFFFYIWLRKAHSSNVLLMCVSNSIHFAGALLFPDWILPSFFFFRENSLFVHWQLQLEGGKKPTIIPHPSYFSAMNPANSIYFFSSLLLWISTEDFLELELRVSMKRTAEEKFWSNDNKKKQGRKHFIFSLPIFVFFILNISDAVSNQYITTQTW